MPELNKFLDLDGLKVFWDQINEKKQNRTIWYNGKQMLLEDCLNRNITNDNLSKTEFFERGSVYTTSLQDNSYHLKGNYCIFSDMCILSAEITMKNGEQFMTYSLPVPTHSQEYAMIYAPDRAKNVCEISVNRDSNSAVLHIQKPNRDSGSTLTETETHFTIIYKI